VAENRRRIDQISDPAFVEGLVALDLDTLKDRRRMCDELENELSYYRRMLHGRMDLLAFELRRRSGAETRTLIEALPEILTDHGQGHDPSRRPVSLSIPDLPEHGRRKIDEVLEADFLTRIALVEEDELREIQSLLIETEHEISEQRRVVHDRRDLIQSELTTRYKNALGGFDELLGRG
jgi:hypothetical protein